MEDSQAEIVRKIEADLRALGLPIGSTVLVHCSLSSLGYVEGGAESVIQGLLKALGPEGTLLIPSLSYELVNDFQPVFDLEKTGSNIGLIPEYFRTRPGTLRSIHPTHSVCGIGPMAREILSGHEQDNTPCGENSPFYKLQAQAGFILMLGCGLLPNTSFHAIEEMVLPPYLFRDFSTLYTIQNKGKTWKKAYRTHNFSGWIQRYDRLRNVLEEPFLRKGKILSATAWLISTPEMWTSVQDKMRENSLYFVDREQ
ncbi:MAG: AAC(3) family N-acetyltransferase [Bacteroidia bacterium]|nr:AAC(3) family N-acetyltransferase [Bacteroidia bacterium]